MPSPVTAVAGCMLAAIALALGGCKPAPTTAPRETFNWGGQAASVPAADSQAIAFAPPGEGWRREGELSGGIIGARFVKERSVGEAIGVGEYHAVGKRLRVAALQELLDKFDSYDRHTFPQAVAIARSRTDDPLSALESSVAAAVNEALDRAVSAYLNDDAEGARNAVAEALVAAGRIQFSLADVLDLVLFSPERKQEPRRYVLLERRDTTIGGEPAVVVDYTVDTGQRVMQCREAYVVHASHLFVATFIGLKENLALFDRVVASIEFP